MIFTINNEDWDIKLVDKDIIKSRYNQEYNSEATYVFGLTLYNQNEIWINEDMCEDQRLRTLRHELAHCYIWSYGLNNTPSFTEEMVCDIVASSYYIIDEIVEDFCNSN
mgnify:CR=1 FL=1